MSPHLGRHASIVPRNLYAFNFVIRTFNSSFTFLPPHTYTQIDEFIPSLWQRSISRIRTCFIHQHL